MRASPLAALLLATIATTTACDGNNVFGPRPFGGGGLNLEPLTDEQAATRTFFGDLAFGSEFGNTADAVRKWVESPTVEIIGGSAEDVVAVQRVLNDIAALTRLAPVVTTSNTGDIRVFFAPQRNFDQLVNVPAGTRGATIATWNPNFELTSATVAIDSAAGGTAREHLIREELTQAFGLLTDSFRHDDSIFFRGASTATEWSALDRLVIALLYRPDILPGMTRTQVDSVFDANRPD